MEVTKMTKKLNIYNHKGITEADNKAILEAYGNGIELIIDESGRVWNEGGEYIADAEETEKGDGIGCL
jgi:hypothetical protein